mmetsp:Transcript_15442/g.36749  ORF Transcript_15442/g.36749 Transcript_15442/m.36749 type:complete len:218 (+) Transcript_15442:366-1019(+)
MGSIMMDFMVREYLAITNGPLAIIRIGTCGSFNKDIPPGNVITAKEGSIYIYRNYMHWDGTYNNVDDATAKTLCAEPYFFTKPGKGSDQLQDLMASHFKSTNVPVSEGLNACGETFFACQRREDPSYDDENKGVIPNLTNLAGTGKSIDFCEMETHELFHLAKLSKTPIAAGACAIALVNRHTSGVVGPDQLHQREEECGKACLSALVDLDVSNLKK